MSDEQEPQLTPEQAAMKERAEKANQILNILNRNRLEGQENLRKKHEQLQNDLDAARDLLGNGPLMNITVDEKTVFSLENAMRNIISAHGSTLTVLEATNTFLNMMVNDLSGCYQMTTRLQNAILVANLHASTLLTLLQEKGIVTEEEVKDCWERMQKEQAQELTS